MRKIVVAAIVIALGASLAGCAEEDQIPRSARPSASADSAPDRNKPTSSPSPTPTPTPSASPSPSQPVTPSPTATATPETPAAGTDIAAADAYRICMEKAIDPAQADPRNTYASFAGSYVQAIDGWWRVWIEGVVHPDGGAPFNIALGCVLNGDVENPTLHGFGPYATDYYTMDQAFEEMLSEHEDH